MISALSELFEEHFQPLILYIFVACSFRRYPLSLSM